LIDSQFVVVESLTDLEIATAHQIAEAIARYARDKEAVTHYPEAEALTLMNRSDLSAREVLLDERAARMVAQERGIPVIGFAGILVRAHWQGLSSAEAVRDALTVCPQQGTHYSKRFIDEVYRRLKEGVP
jgi:predicted nucleic acid-binding protein